MDLAPTILDLAGVSHPVPRGEPSGTYRGRKVYGLRGKSWSTALKRGLVPDDTQAIYGAEDFFGWELGGRAALRKDGWKVSCQLDQSLTPRSHIFPKTTLAKINSSFTT